jgi:hypothetical protein
MGRIRFMVKVVLARRWRRQPEIVMGACTTWLFNEPLCAVWTAK